MTSRRGPQERRYYVNVTDYILWRYAAWRVYHWYDMWFPAKVPGWKQLEKFLRDHGAEVRNKSLSFSDEGNVRLRDRLVAWTVMQDIRCYQLQQWAIRDRDSGVVAEITQEQYERLARK